MRQLARLEPIAQNRPSSLRNPKSGAQKVRVITHPELPAPMAFDQQSILTFQNENRAPNCAWNGLPAPPMKPVMTLNRSLLFAAALKLLPGLRVSKRLNASKNNPSLAVSPNLMYFETRISVRKKRPETGAPAII